MKRFIIPVALVLLTVLTSLWLFQQLAASSRVRGQRIQAANSVSHATLLFAQADQVKGRAKDLKKKIEAQQTNQVEKPTPPPAKK